MSQETTTPPGKEEAVSSIAEHLFRHEAGRLISILTGIFGVRRLQMAEDVVQEAMARALKTWPFYGIPANPRAWLMQTAKHLAVDLIRRENRFLEKQPEIISYLEQRMPDDGAESAPMLEDEIKDDRLRLLFACCHPVLPLEMQAALALKVLGGFSPREIARAFLTTEAAIAKRLTRARQRLQAEEIRFEIPDLPDLPVRLEGVLHTLYLLFNEGYKASSGERTVREELCAEAIRLAGLLAEHPLVSPPRVHALLALMLFNGARLPARTDPRGNLLRLKEQDRAHWSRPMIQRGVYHLDRATTGDEVSEYHLQAGIAACHCLASDDASTDWPRILSLYDHLTEIDDSPLVALNRAVAVAKVYGPARGIAELEQVLEHTPLESYYLTHAVLGDLEHQRQRLPAAAAHFEKALQLAELKSEQVFLTERIRQCAAE
jgi:RNA polymerase sigma factor (sigma-70 family)